MERVLSFFILSDRLGYMGKIRWPHLFFSFSKRKSTNNIFVLIRLSALDYGYYND